MAATYDMHDELVSETQNQADPHLARPENFKVSGTMGKAGDKAVPENTLMGVDGVRHNEDDGPGPHGSGTPTGDNFSASMKGKAFPVQVNKGEGDESPSQMSIPFSIDCESGQIMPNVYSIRNKEA
jgi:hypothetical protein